MSDSDDVGPSLPSSLLTKRIPSTLMDSKTLDSRMESKKQKQDLSSLFLSRLPVSELYGQSYMHREEITQVIVTATDFVVTGSKDGVVKLWKKCNRGIEFVKMFTAHVGAVTVMTVSEDGTMMATGGVDKTLKLFDVINFDMIHNIDLEFTPLSACYFQMKNALKGFLAVFVF